MSQDIPADLPEKLFDDADSEWHLKRNEYEERVMQAAAELIAHSGACGVEVSGHGVTVTIKTHETH